MSDETASMVPLGEQVQRLLVRNRELENTLLLRQEHISIIEAIDRLRETIERAAKLVAIGLTGNVHELSTIDSVNRNWERLAADGPEAELALLRQLERLYRGTAQPSHEMNCTIRELEALRATAQREDGK